MTKITTATPSRLVVTIGLCFMVALMEGLDLQAAGIAAVGMAQAFALDKMQMGWIFSAGILGLLPGALVGGMLADRHGRKRILLGSVLLFGLFSLATALAWSFPTLLLARLLTGVGLGAALPNLIALTSEAAGSRFRGRAVSLMYCGVPIGAALAAALGFSGLAAAWQIIFWIGGVVPLLLIPLLMRWLPESQAFQRAEASVPLRTLFAPGQAAATLLLWLGYFFTLLVVYMLINWLPMLLVGQGFRASQAAGVMFSLQIGAACGTLLLGALMDKLTPLRMSLLIYSGILASLLALGSASSLTGMLLAGFVAGLFATGGQSVLYALAPLFLSRGHPRHRGGHRRGGGASWGDERPAAGRQDAGPRHRHRRGDGGLGAGHCAGRRGGVLADASPAARGHGLICIRRSGKKNAGPPPCLSASPGLR